MKTEHPVLTQVRRGIAANRRPGLHFPGFFLDLETVNVGEGGSHLVMPYGEYCADASGDMNIGAIALLADLGTGASMRVHLPHTSRMATATMQLHFTGERVRSDLECVGRFDGFFQGAAAIQGRVSGELTADGKTVAHASASFATPAPPPGVTIHPVPWACMGREHEVPSLTMAEMSDDEKRVMKAARAALNKATAERSFIQHLWGQVATHRQGGGASNTVTIGPHIGNRVGHVQGGVIFGIAAATAIASLPRASLLTSASAWYISPGTGTRLKVRSSVLQSGKTIAVVRTDVTADDGRLVLAMMTSHTF